MPAISASAPGKIILFGEHAVVYGHPAIAGPVNQVMAKAIVTANPKAPAGSLRVHAPAIGLDVDLHELPEDHPIAATVHNTLRWIGEQRLPACSLRISSSIPVASGLGSGAAVAVAVIRALSSFAGHTLSDEEVSVLAYETEIIHHGTPSGIDNTVVTYRKPIYYQKGKTFKLLRVPVPFTIVIGNTGIPSPTSATVGDVRRAWQADSGRLEQLFDEIGGIARQAGDDIENGRIRPLGDLMSLNHNYLRELAVSCPELDQLVDTAMSAGAIGAKLSGGGRGGNMIALVQADDASKIALALERAGATQTIITEIKEPRAQQI